MTDEKQTAGDIPETSAEETAEEAVQIEEEQKASKEEARKEENPEELETPESDQGEEDGESAVLEKEKSSFFGKRKKEKKDAKDAKIEELTDRLQRSMAEFDNFRKRTEKEKSSMYIVGAKEVVEKILPVVDNFERGLATAPKEDPFAEGMKMIYKQLMTALEELGVKPIEALGAEFNPDFHNAVMHVEEEETGENIIVEEFQKGYTYKDFVVRHSMVKVAN